MGFQAKRIGVISMDTTRDFILCQISESLNTNDVLDLSLLSHRIMLYNSLVALIVLPVEEQKKSGTGTEANRLYNISLSSLKKMCGFSLELFEPISGFDKNSSELMFSKKDMYTFMRKLRNAIAHQNVRFIEEGSTGQVIFFNVFPLSDKRSTEAVKGELKKRKLKRIKSGVEDFRIRMTFEEMRDLSNWIGSEYLRVLQFDPADRTKS